MGDEGGGGRDQGGRARTDFSLAWLEAAWYFSEGGHGPTRSRSVQKMLHVYYCTTPVLNSRVLLMYTDTVKVLQGYHVQNSPSGSFLLWGGALGSEGVVYDIVWRRCPRRTPWMMLRTPVCSYPIIVTHLSFNFLCLLLLYSIYLNGRDVWRVVGAESTEWCIEGQAFSRSYDLAPRPPSLSRQ